MSVLPVGMGSSGVDVGDIGHSLRLRASASAYLSRTFGTPTNNKIWTYSFWIKNFRYSTTTGGYVLSAGSSNLTDLTISSFEKFELNYYGGAGQDYVHQAAPILRDPTSFIHILVAVDTTQATAADRVKFYFNGVQASVASRNDGYMPQNTNTYINQAIGHTCGKPAWGTTYSSDWNISRQCFVDGQALTPSSFGYLNSEINEWVSKTQSEVLAVVEAGGTNSFMLDFDDATSLTTLGYDKSTKNNDWTLNNVSLTSGVTYDHMLDVPGNSYATLNPLIASTANISYANLRSGTTAVQATMDAGVFASGAYWEVTAGASAVTAGVISSTGTTNTTTVTANKVFGFRLTNADALDYINITDSGAWTSITTGLTGERYPYGVTQAADWNFGQRPFIGTASGSALCQANLPEAGTVTVSGSFTGNAAADGPFVWMNGVPLTLTINGNAVTFGTHADKTAGGFKLRTSSASYNTAGSNTWTATITSDVKNLFKYRNAQGNP